MNADKVDKLIGAGLVFVGIVIGLMLVGAILELEWLVLALTIFVLVTVILGMIGLGIAMFKGII